MKRKHLLKSLLVAVGLLVGGSAWAVTVTETYDFGGFITANGAPSNISLGNDVVATQSGTSTFTGGDLYLLGNPTNNGQTLDLNNRFAIDYGNKANVQIRFMWRSSSNAYQHGLAGNWNGKGTANTACHLSVLNLKAGDKITFTYAIQSGRAAQPYLCKSGVVTNVDADAYLASGTEYTIAIDGNLDIYFKNNNFAVSKIVIVTEKEGEEAMGAPSIDVTGVDGNNRTVTITPGVGEGGSAATSTFYTLDGTEPSSTNGVAYTAPFSISETKTVKAVSYLNEAIGEIATKEIEAGTTVTLNAPSIYISEIAANGENFTPSFGVSSNQSSVLLKPAATMSATFNGTEVTLPFTPTVKGNLTVTVSATGYASAETSLTVYPTYVQEWQSLDFSSLIGEEAVKEALDDTWSLYNHDRWASWNSSNTYNFYSTTKGGTHNNRLNFRNVVLLAEGMGLGRNVTGGEAISVTGTSADDIVAFEVYNGYGNAINKGTNTYMSYVMSNGSDNPSMSSTNGALLVQATVYVPVKYESMAIVGDFSANEWDPAQGIAMTRDADDINLWTLTIDEFVAEAKTYEYKATANGNWDDYVLPSGDNKQYVFSTAGKYTLTFTVNTKSHTLTLEAVPFHTYTVAGNNTDMFGLSWDPTDTSNDMTKNADGTYSITYTNIALNEDVQFKVVQDHAWGNEWPSENYVIGIKMAGNYDVTINFDSSTGTVSDAVAIYKGISAAGYATYCTPYDLNFEGTGVTAYVAAINGSEVSFEVVTSAKANTGLLLKADEGTYSLPMQESTSTATSALIGVLAATEVPAGSFVLLNGTPGVGFYKTKNAFTVGANTAYLPAIAGAREFIGFGDDTTTSIQSMDNGKLTMDNVYNLNGQRVVAPQKGLYIVNGKKVILK